MIIFLQFFGPNQKSTFIFKIGWDNYSQSYKFHVLCSHIERVRIPPTLLGIPNKYIITSWDTSYKRKLTFKAANAMHFCIAALKPDQNKQTYPKMPILRDKIVLPNSIFYYNILSVFLLHKQFIPANSCTNVYMSAILFKWC